MALSEYSETAESIGRLAGRPVQDTARVLSTSSRESFAHPGSKINCVYFVQSIRKDPNAYSPNLEFEVIVDPYLQTASSSPTSLAARQEMRVSAVRVLFRCIPQPHATEPRLFTAANVCSAASRSKPPVNDTTRREE